MKQVADPHADRRVVRDAVQGGDPGLPEAAHGLMDRLLDLEEPESLRRAVGGPVHPLDAGDHTVRRCAVTAHRSGVRGLEPPTVRCSASGAGAGGSKGGAASLARAQCVHTG